MAAYARIELRIGKREFLLLTPRQFGLLVRQQRESRQRSDQMVELMCGQLIAMVANTGFRSFEKPREANEFMPSEWAKRPPPEKPKRLTRKRRMEIAEEVKRVFRGN